MYLNIVFTFAANFISVVSVVDCMVTLIFRSLMLRVSFRATYYRVYSYARLTQICQICPAFLLSSHLCFIATLCWCVLSRVRSHLSLPECSPRVTFRLQRVFAEFGPYEFLFPVVQFIHCRACCDWFATSFPVHNLVSKVPIIEGSGWAWYAGSCWSHHSRFPARGLSDCSSTISLKA